MKIEYTTFGTITIDGKTYQHGLSEFGLPIGPWLRELKRAIIENRSDDYLIEVGSKSPTSSGRTMRLEALRPVVTVTPGQKIGYVTDVANTTANREAIVRLVLKASNRFTSLRDPPGRHIA